MPTTLGADRRLDIGQLADVRCRPLIKAEPMEIRILLDGSDPPIGRLCVVDEEPDSDAQPPREVEFSGWLGLLRALDEVIGSTNRDGPEG